MDVVQLKPASPDVETFEIQVEMENFNETTISQRLQINDSRPEDKRYEVGKTIRLRIDETLESRPFIIPESIQFTITHSQVALLVLCWLLLVLALAGNYAFLYWYVSFCSGLRFVPFLHPLVLFAPFLFFTHV